MIRHILISYYRNAVANASNTLITCLGLSIAIAVMLLIFLYVFNELTFDRFHENSDRIFRLTTTITTPAGENHLAIANTAFAHILKNELPEIDNLACIDIGGTYHVKYGNQIFREENVRFSTPGIFDLFSYDIIRGNPESLLTAPGTTVLTESLANKLFGNEDPVGELVSFNDLDYLVAGVIKDLPVNTDMKYTALLASSVDGSEHLLDWDDYYVYLLMHNGIASTLQSRINTITDQTYQPILPPEYQGISIAYNLQPLTDIHFDTSYLGDTPKGNRTNIYAFSCIAFLILIISCINYINLHIAMAVSRKKEMLIRRIAGSGRLNNTCQLTGESVITTLISFAGSLLLAVLLLPVVNELANTNFDSSALTSSPVIMAMLTIVVLIGFVAGIFPVAYQLKLTGNKNNAQNNIKSGFSNISKGLVTFQFVLSIAMICAVLFAGKQISFMKNADTGFNSGQILAINLNLKECSVDKLDALKQEFSNWFGAENIATGGGGTQLGATGEWMKSINVVKNADGEEIQFISNSPEIDENYITLFGISLVEGRNFSKDFPADYNESVIVNSTYVNTMGWKQPVGEVLYEDSPLRVIGVVNDFHFISLHNRVEPLAFRFNDRNPAYLFLKIAPDELYQIRPLWDQFFRDIPLEYKFVDENFQRQYIQNEKQETLLGYLSFVAIMISCLGLYGLSSFFITKRTKEIGIRKVNGAKIWEVMAMLNLDFVKWVVIAFVLATPVAWYAMNKWLQNFAYRTELSWWIFALAGMLALVIALLTVSWQSWRAARRNPVEALRYE